MKCRVCGKENPDVPYNHCCWPCRVRLLREFPKSHLARGPQPNKPRRGWFQIHLSTAIVLMFVAGGMIWVNCLNREVNTDMLYHVAPDGTIINSSPRHVYGWPFGIYEDYNINGEHVKRGLKGPFVTSDILTDWNLWAAVFNISSALPVLGVVAFLCEWLIRRREARKP